MGAAYGVAKLTAKSTPTFCEKIVWCAVVALVVALGLLVLVDLQGHLSFTRARQTAMEERFSPEDRKLVEGRRWMPQWFVFVVLCVVVIVGGTLAGYAIWQL
jgi:hypothetical protein